jgi:hypothetical protein
VKLYITTEQGVVVDSVDLDDYDLSKGLAAQGFVAEVREIIERGQRMEQQERQA